MSENKQSHFAPLQSNKLLISSVSGALFGGGIASIFMSSYYFIDDVIFNTPHENILFYLVAGACAVFASSEIKKLNQ